VQTLLKIGFWILIAYAGYCGLVFVIQRQVMFPRHRIRLPEADHLPGLEKIWLNTRFGKVETCFLAPVSSEGPAPAVIFAHGNAELIDFWVQELKNFNRFGAGVLLVEYPGYGRSDGSPTQENIAEAFVAAYDMMITRQDVDSSRIVLFGRSIGGGAVCALAGARPSAAMILMSTFISARSLVKKYLVPGMLVRDPFDNLSVVRSYPGPVLVIHGKKDEIIPYSHSVALSRAARNGKIITYECGHNDCPPIWDDFWQDIEFFLHEARITPR
jgi:pimeloyl-ACP methyl ester carboxylesterase